jgi:hypothetical protein
MLGSRAAATMIEAGDLSLVWDKVLQAKCLVGEWKANFGVQHASKGLLLL